MNRLYESRARTPGAAEADEAVKALVEGAAFEFEALTETCPDGAFRLLKAIAAEGCVGEPTSGAFLSRHGLRAPSSVAAALKTLKAADLVSRTERGYVVSDRLFGLWLSRW